MAEGPEVTTFPVPKTVYHYCSQEAALAILGSGTVWLNHQRSMNDPQDTQWIIPRIQTHLNRHIDPANLGSQEAQRVREFWQLFSASTPDVYVACFSQFGDVLSQWRAYADDGSGFALGFSPQGFGIHEIRVPVLSFDANRTIGMINVIYNDDTAEGIFGPFLDSVVKGDVAMDAAALLMRGISMWYKNPAYREEKEWRLIFSPFLNYRKDQTIEIFGKLTEIFFRKTRHGIFPYFQLPFTVPAINEVILGPKNRTPIELIKLWLLRHGHLDAEIKKSTASYR